MEDFQGCTENLVVDWDATVEQSVKERSDHVQRTFFGSADGLLRVSHSEEDSQSSMLVSSSMDRRWKEFNEGVSTTCV